MRFFLMAMFYGLATMGTGILMASRERAAFWVVARSLLAIHLLFVGAILFVVGLSERRARAQYREATQNDPDAKAASE